MNDNKLQLSAHKEKFFRLFAFIGILSIAISLSMGNFLIGSIIVCLPIILVGMLLTLQFPVTLLFIIFTVNYFIMGLTKYLNISGISVIMDTLLIVTLIFLIIHSILVKDIEWKYSKNILTLFSIVWMFYCIIEILNPTGVLKGWILSRGLIFNGLILTIITSLLITQKRQVDILIFLYSTFTLLAVIKAIVQKYIGFDSFELQWLTAGGGAITHLIPSGTRYFSFFTDAGNLGSNMGCAGIMLGIIAYYIHDKGLKIYYGIISILALYGMLLSGTRGAIIVPIGGLALYTLISKNYKAMIAGSIMLAITYSFFAFTYIGQSNSLVRRMRTAFTPSKDASFNVRKENQRKLGEYLQHKPFGEGLGLSGVENQKTSMRFTTTIPHDSWYVKIWVETGIIGLILYIGGLLAVIIKCAQIIMFKIKNKEFRGILSGMLCGIFGMMLSAYGNAFWGQYPTMILVFIFLSLILKGEYFDKQIAIKK